MNISIQSKPNIDEVRKVLITAYDNLYPDDSARFTDEQDQGLDDWFSLKDIPAYDGKLLEARDDSQKLIGIAYVGKENILSWPDGHKAKLYLLAVLPEARGKGLGQELIKRAEEEAKNMEASSIIIDTHVLMEADQRLYRDKMGYETMGVLKNYYDNGDAIFFSKKL